MKYKNLALKLLKKLISEQVKIYKKTNIVKSQEFSSIIQEKINLYLNGILTNEEVIGELLKIAKEITSNNKLADKLGLLTEEMAFYDALTKPQAIKDFYQNNELVSLTKELLKALQNNKVLDWQNKQSSRATMRKMIKRLLKKYGYPPDKTNNTTNIVMQQCELWADNIMKI